MGASRQIISIGGGGFGRNPGVGIIEQYILDQTKKRKPKICFIPTATGDLELYKLNYYATFSNLNCQPTRRQIKDMKRVKNMKEQEKDNGDTYNEKGNRRQRTK